MKDRILLIIGILLLAVISYWIIRSFKRKPNQKMMLQTPSNSNGEYFPYNTKLLDSTVEVVSLTGQGPVGYYPADSRELTSTVSGWNNCGPGWRGWRKVESIWP